MKTISRRTFCAVLPALTGAVSKADIRGGEGPLANGVYAVVREGFEPDPAQPVEAGRKTLLYDQKYSDADRDRPALRVALDTRFFVPLALDGPPVTGKDERGRTLLHLALTPEHTKTLERFTRMHLSGRIAIVVDGEIVSMHTVRAVIHDGRARITRCQDDACSVLRLKLSK